jgi:hypothetical protein
MRKVFQMSRFSHPQKKLGARSSPRRKSKAEKPHSNVPTGKLWNEVGRETTRFGKLSSSPLVDKA